MGKKNLSEKELIQNYKKSHTLVAKKTKAIAIALIAIGCAGGVAGGVTAGILANRENIRQSEIKKENETVVIDPSSAGNTVISKEFVSDKDGNKIGVIESTNDKNITAVTVTKGDTLLKAGEDYVATPTGTTNNEETSKKWIVTILKNTFTKYNGKVKIVAKYEETPTGEIIINLDDQFPGGSSTRSISINNGELLDYPSTPHYDNYVFAGWYLDKECTKSFNFSKPVTENTSLYGKWEESSEKGLLFIPDDATNPTSYTVRLDPDHKDELPDYVAIPSKHNDKPVVGIEEWHYSTSNSWDDDGSFAYATMKSISIPSTISSIPYYAFYYCTSLKSVSLPNTIRDLGYCAFYNCTSLADINLNEGLQSIQSRCFYYSGLRSVTFPSTITFLGEYLFYYSYPLKSVDFSKCVNLIEIPYYCFYCCYSLKNVILPVDGNLSKIGYDAFECCYSLESIYIPSSVEYIADYAFYECYSLKSVEFASNSHLSLLGEKIFAYCYYLQHFEIPASVTYFNYDLFYYCESLSEIVFKNTTDTYYVVYTDGGTKKIEKYNPHDPSAMKPIDLINKNASFRLNGIQDETRGIEFVAISDDECIVSRKIDETKTEISIPLEVTYNEKTYKVVGIGAEAFNEANASSNYITSVTFEIDGDNENKNLRFISRYAFYDCGYLHSFVNLDKCVNLNNIGDGAFEYVSYECQDEDKFDLDLSNTNLKYIANEAFYYTYKLKSIKLPESLIAIGNSAFDCCYSLETADLSICSNLEILGFNEDYDEEGGCVFADCRDLTTIDLSNTNLYIIPISTFEDSGLTSVKLPDTIVSIENDAFNGCELTSITIPKNVIKIGSCAFDYCNDLTEVIVDSPLVNLFFANQSKNKILEQCLDIYVPVGTVLEPTYIEGFVKQDTSPKPGYDYYKWNQ